MNGRVAILIPTHNGGPLLRRTVESCLDSGLGNVKGRVIVVDNASTDGSVDQLSAEVTIIKSPHNLGRVANWNRALEIAEQSGFEYAAFLFVGDEWIADDSFSSLLASMEANQSVMGMAALRIVGQDGALLRTGARVTIRGTAAQVNSRRLLAHSIGTGRLPFAPIQANVYRLYRDHPLRFSCAPEDALNSDLEATVQYLQKHPGSVSIGARPYLLWRERPGRFFTAQDPYSVLLSTRRTLRRLSALTGISVDWKSANAVAMLASIRETSSAESWRARFWFRSRALRYLVKEPSGLSPITVASFLARKLIFGRNYLDFSSDSEPVRTQTAAL